MANKKNLKPQAHILTVEEAKTAALNNGEDESTVTNTLDLILAEMREQAENEI